MSDTRICLWSGPRNISTALMYAFAQRPDTVVYDEPLYGWYLHRYPAAQHYHPGAAAIVANMETDETRIIEWMLGPHPKPVVFFKQMTHHLLDMNRSFLPKMVNVILTRDPVDMLPSYARVVQKPGMQDVGYADHLALVEQLEQLGHPPIVIDAKRLLLDPAGVLQRWCERMQLPFFEEMLQWPAGPRPEDGIWAKYWYHNVHRSTGFTPYRPKTGPFPEALRPLLEQCLPLYEELKDRAL